MNICNHKVTILVLFILGAYSCTQSNGSTDDSSDQPQGNEWELVWSDEFDQNILDQEKWNILLWRPGWVNNELQAYTAKDDNIFLENGNLVLQALYQPGYTGSDHQGNAYTSNYTSGRINTAGKAEWTYGKYEIRAKLPKGVGSWPAIWMLGSSISTIGWPACGEIDIMEHVGFDEGVVHASIHTTDYNHNKNTQKSGSTIVPTATDSFHVYTLEWAPTYLYFLVDDVPYHFVYNDGPDDDAKWPFYNDAFMILNVAVGGDWGGIGGIDNSTFPMQMLVDYVRVYETTAVHHDINVTFQVDMSQQLVSGTGVWLSGGSIGAGQPGGIPMEDTDGDGIWSVTLTLPKGSVHTYKFRNGYFPDSWNGGWETVPGNCSGDEQNNRQLITPESDTILPPVCFGSCTNCG